MKPSRRSIFRHVDKSKLRQVPHVGIRIGKIHLIKGRNFTLAKLFNGNFNGLEKTGLYNPKECSVGIFRLAPQDYHSFHSPMSGKIGPIKYSGRILYG